MAKIENDKYYTPKDLAKYCVEKTKEVIGENNITEYIEPSAGSGVFLDYLDKPYMAFDIEPECDKIVNKNWLEVDLDYKQGRCIIGNPPFGDRNTLAVQFYKKSVQLCDYIAFILPISQWNNNQQMYEFDLIHSEDLGKREYSGIVVHCCFNIYKRNDKGLNHKPKYKLQDISIKEFRSKEKALNSAEDFDIRICFWGAATGKIVEKGQYSHEMGIKINNQSLRKKIIQIFENNNWKDVYYMTSTPALYQWQIYKYLKEQIPELK